MSEDLIDIEGVGETKAKALKEAGYKTLEDIREASQEELSEVEGIGKALAARIKADVGGLEVEEVEEKPVGEEEITSAVSLSDKTPKLDSERKEALEKRNKEKENRPNFKRQDRHKKKRIPSTWRRPKGTHSKQRKQIKGKGARAKIGFRSPKEARGLHPSGFEEVLIYRPEEITELNPDKEAARIASSVGGRKREKIEEKALEEKVRILNPTYDDES